MVELARVAIYILCGMFLYFFLFLILLSVCGLLLTGKIVTKSEISLISNRSINSFFLRQLIGLIIAFSISAFAVLKNGNKFLAFGNLSAHPSPIDWLGVNAESTWLKTALELSLTIISITLIFLLQVLVRNRPLPKLKLEIIFWSVLFALTNSLTEELIFRFALLNLMQGLVNLNVAVIISAFFFGLPHYKGMPNGILGVLMATFLGFVLAKSVLETEGLLIAWSIHFALDIPIILTLLWTSKDFEPS